MRGKKVAVKEKTERRQQEEHPSRSLWAFVEVLCVRAAVLIALVVVTLAVLLIPIEWTIAPNFTLVIQDMQGSPVAGVSVRQTWAYYGLFDTTQEEDRVTNVQGEVSFSKRTISASLLQLLRARFKTLLNVHSSYGPHYYLSVHKRGFTTVGPIGEDDLKQLEQDELGRWHLRLSPSR